MTEFICATPLFQANSGPQGATHRAAVVSAAVLLNDVSLQTNLFAVVLRGSILANDAVAKRHWVKALPSAGRALPGG